MASLTRLNKAFDCVDHNQLWKILKRSEKQTTLPASCETCMQLKKQQLELDMEQWTGSKLGKESFPVFSRSTSRLYIVTLLFNFYAEYIM